MNSNELITSPPDVDEVARQAGLRPVKAWVSDDTQRRKTSGAAERTRRAREKAELAGIKQVSLAVPLEHHGLLKEFAERARSGQSAAAALSGLLETVGAPGMSLPALSSWRRWLIQRLLPVAWRRHVPMFYIKS